MIGLNEKIVFTVGFTVKYLLLMRDLDVKEKHLGLFFITMLLRKIIFFSLGYVVFFIIFTINGSKE